MASNEYLEILAGHVFDHDKLVTYKWLSKELEVHVNIAKQMLWEFYEKYRDRDNIECTYLLIGMLKENEMRVEVVRESDLSKAKEKFSKIISEHMYSVHKPLGDLELLASSDTAGDVRFSAIKCDACVERSDEEMNLLRWGTAAMKITEGKVVNSKPVEPVNRSKINKEPVAAKKNGFNNFFNTAGKQKSPETSKVSKTEKNNESEDKNNSPSNDIDLTEKGKGSKKNKSPLEKSKGTTGSSKSKKTSSKAEETNKTKKGGLESFFGKMSLPKPAEVKVPEKKEEEIKVSEKKEEEVKVSEKKEEEVKVSEKKEEEVKVSKKKEEEIFETKKVKEKQKPRGKKRIRSQGSDRDTKKRKRIVVQTDSSDSEAQSDMDIEEPMPEAVAETEAPIRPKSPSPPAVKHENGKRKMLKMMNETYKDDRGFIVTKKVHVYVSCSEDEEEKEKEEKEKEQKKKEEKEREEKKKKEKGLPSKKQMKVDNAKKKQSVLTSFFNKAS